MSLRPLLRKPFSITSSFPRPRPHHPPIFPKLLRYPPRRFTSTSSESRTRSRIDRVLSRLPRFLHPYTSALRTAPISHIISFLILHEITAIVPLIGLAGLFHYTQWLPKGFIEGRWVGEGMERFGRYFGRKGWFGFSRQETSIGGGDDEEGLRDVGGDGAIEEAERKWHVGERGGRILVEVATAYAITKVLLPVRVILSVWATPWFARVFVGRVGRLFGRGKGVGGAVGKNTP